MTNSNATTPKVGDIVRVVFGIETLDARVIDIEDGEVDVRLIWNDHTTPEDEIEPFYQTYRMDEILPKD